MALAPDPSIREYLSYDSDTGIFTWIKATSQHRRSGVVAGCINSRGYVRIGFKRRYYLAHRLAWYFATGDWPELVIDHINGVTDDNRLCNLRPANKSQNAHNSFKPLKGVSFQPSAGKWRARIRVGGGRELHLGCFATAKAAKAAYDAAAIRHFGEFARLT